MTTQTSPLSPSRIRPDIRAMLEYHILEELPLREACRRAGLKYTKNSSQRTESGLIEISPGFCAAKRRLRQ